MDWKQLIHEVGHAKSQRHLWVLRRIAHRGCQHPAEPKATDCHISSGLQISSRAATLDPRAALPNSNCFSVSTRQCNGRVWGWQLPGALYISDCMVPRVKFRLWGVVGFQELGSASYRWSERNSLCFMMPVHFGIPFLFQHDCVPVHIVTSKKTWKREFRCGITWLACKE